MSNKATSLKQLTVSASTWVMIEYFITQSLRFGSNIILTRLLAPEMFGLMQLVTVFIFGMELMSDLGVRVNIIQHKDGDKKEFLRTAWSFQTIRGVVFCLLSTLIAIPFANFYNYNELKFIIPITCFSLVFSGLKSTNLYAYEKHLRLRLVSIINIVSWVIATIVMLAIAYEYRTVWALVAFVLVNSFVVMVLSFRIPGVKMKLLFDKEVFREILHFGKWIVLSSFLAIFLSSLDKLFLGKVVSIDLLGFYGIAAAIPLAVLRLLRKYSSSVLLPVFRKLINESLSEKRNKMFKIRLAVQGGAYIIYFILVIWGQDICDWIYPDNYSEVGKIIRILAWGGAASIVPFSIGPVILASGNSFRPNIIIVSKIVVQLLLMYYGNQYFGFEGIIYGIAFAEVAIYPIMVLCIYEYGVWMPWFDLCSFAFCFVVGAAVLFN